MPDGAGFTDKGQLIFLASSEDLSPLMAVLNSELILVTLLLLNPSRFTEVNDLAILPVPRKMPRRLGEIAERMVAIKREWAAGLEPSREFVAPHLARVDGDTLAARLENIQVLERSNDDELQPCILSSTRSWRACISLLRPTWNTSGTDAARSRASASGLECRRKLLRSGV